MAAIDYHDAVQEIYIAYYGRPADPVGLNFWAVKLEAAGGDLTEIIDAFGNSAESSALYNGASDTAKISQIYEQLFNRAPEAQGLNYYVNLLANGQATLATIALDILNGATGEDATVIGAKLQAANNFTQAIDPGAETSAYDGDWAGAQARDWLHGVTEPGQGGNPQAVLDAIVAGPSPDAQVLTPTIDLIDASAGQTVVGGTDTLTPGDQIQGGAQVQLSLAARADNYAGTSIDGAQQVAITPLGDVVVDTKNWTNVSEIAVHKVRGDLTLQDLQSDQTQFTLNDAIRPEDTIHLNLDGQGLSQGAVSVSVNEINANVLIDTDAGFDVDTIDLHIADTRAGFESTLSSLHGDGTTTLNITGGRAGLDFGIQDALDAGLQTLNAQTALANLTLDVSESNQAMDITLGLGNDTLTMGDSLRTGDVIDGGAGNDRVIAVFDENSASVRAPEMRRVETLEATFLNSLHVDGSAITGLQTIDLNASSGRADFDLMKESVNTLNVKGDLDQGVEFDFDGAALSTLAINLQGPVSYIGNAANPAGIRVINANKVSLSHNGDQDVVILGGVQVDESFSGQYTTDLSLSNHSTANLSVFAPTTIIRDGGTVERLSVTSTDVGDMNLGDCDTALMANAQNLQHFVASSATDSDIHLGRVGTNEAATDLESIKLSVGVSSEVTSHGFDASQGWWHDGDGATVNTVDVTVNSSGYAHLYGGSNWYPVNTPTALSFLDGEGSYDGCYGTWLDAASLNVMNVSVARGGVVDGGMFGLVGLELGAQAGANSKLVLSGEGSVTGFAFTHENVATIDASGLSGSGVVIAMLDEANASSFTFLGTENSDRVYASDDDDALYGNDGHDVLWARAGDDIVDGGKGNDALFGQEGNDILDGGEGKDFLAGGQHADVLTGGSGADGFYFYFGDQEDTDAGKSTNPGAANKQDLITDFTFGEDTLYVDIDNRDSAYFNPDLSGAKGTDWGLSPNSLNSDYAMYVTNFPGANPISTGGYIGSGDIHVVVRVGTYNENGTFNYNVGGTDLQVLFNENGNAFDPLDAILNNGNVAFNGAVHEIGLLGAASQLGSLATTDLVWV